MTTSLFSTYSGGENRVTSSIMAVLERIELALVRDIQAGAQYTSIERLHSGAKRTSEL